MLLGRGPYPRRVLRDSYQHLLLAAATGLLVCLTPVPSLGALVFVGVQLWRTRVLARMLTSGSIHGERLDLHRRGYFATSGVTLRWMGGALLLGLMAQFVIDGAQGIALARSFIALALVLSLRVLWRSYKVMVRDRLFT